MECECIGMPTKIHDFLCCRVLTALGSHRFQFQSIINLNGKLINNHDIFATDHLTDETHTICLPTHGGSIVSVNLRTIGTTSPPGTTSAKIYLSQGSPPPSGWEYYICSGFPSNTSPLCYPGPSLGCSYPPEGSPVNLQIPDVTGPPSIYTIPNAGIWMIHRISFLYTTHAEAGNRFVYVYLFDAGGVSLYRISCVTAMTAGQTRFFYFDSSVIDEVLTDDAFHLPMAPVYLNKNDDINIGAVGAKGGDTITNATIQLKLWSVY